MGGTAGNWLDPANWALGIPSDQQVARIGFEPYLSKVVVTLGQNESARAAYLMLRGDLVVQGGLELFDPLGPSKITGTLTMRGGGLRSPHPLVLGGFKTETGGNGPSSSIEGDFVVNGSASIGLDAYLEIPTKAEFAGVVTFRGGTLLLIPWMSISRGAVVIGRYGRLESSNQGGIQIAYGKVVLNGQMLSSRDGYIWGGEFVNQGTVVIDGGIFSANQLRNKGRITVTGTGQLHNYPSASSIGNVLVSGPQASLLIDGTIAPSYLTTIKVEESGTVESQGQIDGGGGTIDLSSWIGSLRLYQYYTPIYPNIRNATIKGSSRLKLTGNSPILENVHLDEGMILTNGENGALTGDNSSAGPIYVRKGNSTEGNTTHLGLWSGILRAPVVLEGGGLWTTSGASDVVLATETSVRGYGLIGNPYGRTPRITNYGLIEANIPSKPLGISAFPPLLNRGTAIARPNCALHGNIENRRYLVISEGATRSGYTVQSGGSTAVYGTLEGLVEVTGGVLEGCGTITAELTCSSVIRVSGRGSQLTMRQLVLQPTGKVALDLRDGSAPQMERIAVTTFAKLAGTLEVTFPAGYSAPKSTRFLVATIPADTASTFDRLSVKGAVGTWKLVREGAFLYVEAV